MLVLARRIGESIVIHDDIKVTVVSVRGQLVKLGIEAPHDISVHRAEIAAKIIAENRKAAASVPLDLAALHDVWCQYGNQERR